MKFVQVSVSRWQWGDSPDTVIAAIDEAGRIWLYENGRWTVLGNADQALTKTDLTDADEKP